MDARLCLVRLDEERAVTFAKVKSNWQTCGDLYSVRSTAFLGARDVFDGLMVFWEYFT